MIVGGKDPWFDPLYEKHVKNLVHTAEHHLHNHALAEDIVHDTFILLLTKKEKVLKDYKTPEAFLYGVLRNRVGNEMQRAANRLVVELKAEHEKYMAFDAFKERIEDILPLWLTEKERKIIILRAEEDLSWEEIGRRVGKSPRACEACMSRLRKKFKERYKISN